MNRFFFNKTSQQKVKMNRFTVLESRNRLSTNADCKSGRARFFRAHSSTLASRSLPLSAKDGDRLDEEKARLDNVDKAEKGENNTAATEAGTVTATSAANAAQPNENKKTPEKGKAEVVKDKPDPVGKAEEDKKSNKSNGAHTPV